MKEKLKSENPNIKRCSCGRFLWDWLEEDTMRLFSNGNEFIIRFNYI